MTLTSELVFSIEIVSLPVGGMITRIACGSTMRRIVCRRVSPSAEAASVWPSSTEMIPARTISAMYAPSFRPSARIAARNGVISVLALACTNSGPPNGMPIEIRGYSAETKLQNRICTSTGVPRKNQM
jgi:hypothetical protein